MAKQRDRAIQILNEMISSIKERGETLLPPEHVLAADLEVGRNTLRSAIDHLVQQGKVRRIQGKGTFVIDTQSTLTFSNWSSLEFGDRALLDDFINDFQKGEDVPRISCRSYPYTLYEKRVVQEIVAGEAPDVMQLTSFELQRFKHSSVLMPLTSYRGDLVEESQFGNALDLCLQGDDLYALHWTLCPQVLYYNKTVMEKAGLDPDRPPETMDEFEEACLRISGNCEPGTYGLSLPLDSFGFSFMQIYPFLMAFGGGFSDSIGNLQVDSAENIEAFEWLSTLYRKCGAMQERNINGGRTLFAANRLGFMIDGPYGRGHLRRMSGMGKSFDKNYGVAVIPRGRAGNSRSVLLTHSLGLSWQCQDPENAIKWIEFLRTDKAGSIAYYDEFGMLPASKELLYQDHFQNDPFGRVLTEQLQNITTDPVTHPLFIKSLPFLLQVAPRIILEGRDAASELGFLRNVISILGLDKIGMGLSV